MYKYFGFKMAFTFAGMALVLISHCRWAFIHCNLCQFVGFEVNLINPALLKFCCCIISEWMVDLKIDKFSDL